MQNLSLNIMVICKRSHKTQPLLNSAYFFNSTDTSKIFNTVVVLLYVILSLTPVLLGGSCY